MIFSLLSFRTCVAFLLPGTSILHQFTSLNIHKTKHGSGVEIKKPCFYRPIGRSSGPCLNIRMSETDISDAVVQFVVQHPLQDLVAIALLKFAYDATREGASLPVALTAGSRFPRSRCIFFIYTWLMIIADRCDSAVLKLLDRTPGWTMSIGQKPFLKLFASVVIDILGSAPTHICWYAAGSLLVTRAPTRTQCSAAYLRLTWAHGILHQAPQVSRRCCFLWRGTLPTWLGLR